jgi:hypothetical protein
MFCASLPPPASKTCSLEKKKTFKTSPFFMKGMQTSCFAERHVYEWHWSGQIILWFHTVHACHIYLYVTYGDLNAWLIRKVG